MHTTARRFGVVAGAALLLGTLALQAPAQAEYATGGAGLYIGDIDWVEWGAPNESIPAAGKTVTQARSVAGRTLTTTCTIGEVTGGAIHAYRPGSWTGDGFDELYNIGGVGGANELIAGISNVNGGTNPQFSFSCAVDLDGSPVPLAGLVMADAEQSGSTEWIEATIPSGTWRIIDRHRTSGCANSSNAILDPSGTALRLQGSGICGAGPMAVAFMDGASSADVNLRGAGKSAIALGVVLSADFSDAPATYGEAGAILSPSFTGGTLTPGEAEVNDDAFALATMSPPSLRLGAAVTGDAGPAPSPGADGDGVGDDGITPSLASVVRGGVYAVNADCSGTGSVRGWLDWDRDGSFGADEASNIVSCAGGSAELQWTVPNDTVTSIGASHTYLRLIIGADAAAVATPTAFLTSGEVEDYAQEVALPGPTAAPDEAVTSIDTPVTFDPLDNDVADPSSPLDPTTVRLIDPMGDPVEALVTAEGEFEVDTATGEITFTPAPGYIGTTPALGYQVTDSSGRTATSTISVEVVPAAAVGLFGPGSLVAALGLAAAGVLLSRRRRASLA